MKEIGNLLALKEGDYVNCGGKYYRYVGAFDSIDKVPKLNCIFRIERELFKRTVTANRSENLSKLPVKKDTSEKLNLTIDIADNELMIIVKELLKDYTKNDFDKLFDDETVKNNMRRVLKDTHELTWKRFTLMLEVLNMTHQLSVSSLD